MWHQTFKTIKFQNTSSGRFTEMFLTLNAFKPKPPKTNVEAASLVSPRPCDRTQERNDREFASKWTNHLIKKDTNLRQLQCPWLWQRQVSSHYFTFCALICEYGSMAFIRGEFRQMEREGRGGEGWKELRMKERRSITAWTILCAKNAALSSSTVKLGLSLMQKQRATHKIIAMFLCFCFCFFFFHLYLLAWIHARQQLFYFGKLKKRSLGSCLVFTWLMHSNASLLAILPRKTPG